MNLTSPQAFTGLITTATPQNPNVSNDVTVGIGNAATALSSATDFVSFDAVIVGSASDLVIDISDLDSTGTTAWTAGTAQVETATAVGTIGTSGNASVVVTAADVTGSPVTVSVAVTAGDTAAVWGPKVVTALAANTAIAAVYTAGGTGASITLTRKATTTYTVGATSVPVYPADDATLNISLDNDTCTGITTATTSANTTAGVATAGVYVPDLDGNDFEGNATGGATVVYGVQIKNSTASGGDGITLTQSTTMVDQLVPAQGVFQTHAAAGGLSTSDITIEPENAGPCFVEVTLATS